jgi:hypothetical protein
MIEFRSFGRHARENGNPESKNEYIWIPASAGMTSLGKQQPLVIVSLPKGLSTKLMAPEPIERHTIPS